MFLAGIQKNSLDTAFPRYDESDPETQFYASAIWAILAVCLAILLLFCCVSEGGENHKQDLPCVNVQRIVRDDLLGVYSLTPDEGWACGRRGVVLHTEDGGLTWTRQQTGTDLTLTSIFFADSKEGWSVGDEGTILHTDDGGATWVRQQSPVPFYLMDVFFASPQRGWIVTEQTYILHTVDGGQSWQVQFQDQDFILKAVTFADPLNGWAVGEYGCIYHTADGGITWKRQAGSYRFTETTGEIEAGITLFDVTAVDARTAWAVGLDGQVLKTTDGGDTWSPMATGAPSTQLFSAATDKNGTIIIAGKGVLLFSEDGGQTWESPNLDPPISWGWIYGLAISRSRTLLGVGWKASIYRSEGDLRRWRKVLGGQ